MSAHTLLDLIVCVLPAAALWPWLKTAVPSPAARAGAAIGFGLALSSTLFFLWRVAGGSASHYAMLDVPLWSAVAVVGARRRRAAATDEARPRTTAPWLVASAIVLVLLASALIADWMLANPYGRWDAWAIWNLKARFLAASGGDWRHALAVIEAHPDYPLLIPGAVARAWAVAGAARAAVPMAIALLFFGATVATIAGSLQTSRGTAPAVAGLALVTVPMFTLLGGSQMADVPLAFFTVLALTLLAAPHPTPERLMLAGAAAAFGAWTKNEGLVVAVALPVIYLLVRWRQDGVAAVTNAAPALAVGVLPVLLLVAWFKLHEAPASVFAAGLMNAGALHRWLEPQRVLLVARYTARGLSTWGGWPFGGPMWLLALLVVVPGRRQVHGDHDAGVRTAGVLLIVQSVVFFSVYVMTPEPLAWHLETSWSRVTAQLWPTAVWWACARRSAVRYAD